MPGIGGTHIDLPGSPYNGMLAQAAIGLAAKKAAAGDPTDLKTLKALPQFQGFGWQGFLAMAGIMGGGALASVIGGLGGSGAAAGATGSTVAGTGAPLGEVGAISGAGVAAVPGAVGPAAAGLTGASTSLFSRLFPTLVSSGTSLLGGILGANAAGNAASLQAAAANRAADLQYKASQDSLAFQRETLAQQQKNLQPWLDAGTGALKSIGDITSTPYALPTAEEAAKTPGFQFELQQGLNAVQAYERATGQSLSGKAAKDINNFAQGTASANYQNTVQNSLAARAANLNPLLSEAGLGQVATGNLNQDLSTSAGLNTNTNLQTAANVGNLQQQAAQATSSGYVSGANSWINALGNIGNNIQQSQTIQQILAALAGRQAIPAAI
jgi:hypothetical protein